MGWTGFWFRCGVFLNPPKERPKVLLWVLIGEMFYFFCFFCHELPLYFQHHLSCDVCVFFLTHQTTGVEKQRVLFNRCPLWAQMKDTGVVLQGNKRKKTVLEETILQSCYHRYLGTIRRG